MLVASLQAQAHSPVPVGSCLPKPWMGTSLSGQVPHILYDGLKPICAQTPCLERENGINSAVTVLKLKLSLTILIMA